MTNSITELHANAERGDLAAQFNLGTAYSIGMNGPPNFQEAAKWYLKAAEQGHAYAQHQIGLFYFHGWGVSEDYTEAEKWYRKAEEQGLKEASSALKNLYYTLKSAQKEKSEDHLEKKLDNTILKDYQTVARIVGSVSAILVFTCSWIYCITKYGFLLGVGVGWLPSGILAAIVGFITGCFWPLTVLGMIYAFYLLI